MFASRAALVALYVVLLLPAGAAHAGIWNLNAGLANQRQTDRETEEKTISLDFIGSVSCRSMEWDFKLDLHLSWDKGLNQDVWNRKGDFLRPLDTLVHSPPEGGLSYGLEVVDDWTPGGGYLVRSLTGRAEIDYVLP